MAFPERANTALVDAALVRALLPVLLAPHASDPTAAILRLPLRGSDGYAGAWAGKIGSHAAHHRFGEFGRLPHLQLNLWRIGVKGSGIAVRMPLPALRRGWA
jgi:hypothetical protein